jgi:hypothetical protein
MLLRSIRRSCQGGDNAIDHRQTSDAKEVSGAINYVKLARGQSLSGKLMETAATRLYGCSVKYPGVWFGRRRRT